MSGNRVSYSHSYKQLQTEVLLEPVHNFCVKSRPGAPRFQASGPPVFRCCSVSLRLFLSSDSSTFLQFLLLSCSQGSVSSYVL